MSIRPAMGATHTRTETVTEADLKVCGELSRETSTHPLGIAFVLALRTLIEARVVPEGAIMLGYRATWHEEPRPGIVRTELAIRAVDAPRTRFQRVVLGYRTTAGEDERLLFEQEQEVLWPISA